jgi:hypothetical protein
MTLEQLQNLDYSVNPFSKGMIADDYRKEYAKHGERVRWWKGYTAEDGIVGPNGETVGRSGHLHIEQKLAPEVRAIFTQTKREILDTQFGTLPKGSTQISVIPDEIFAARGDWFLAEDKEQIGRYWVEPTGDITDIPFRFVKRIIAAYTEDGPLSEASYEVSAHSSIRYGNAVSWLQGVPATPVAIEVVYAPLFIFLDVSDRLPFRGPDDKFLPQIGVLTQERL